MRIFQHPQIENYIGTVVIVMAESVTEAHSMIRDELDNIGCRSTELDIIELESEKKCIIYSRS